MRAVKPQQFADPDCAKCHGAGMIYFDDILDDQGRKLPEQAERCSCALVYDYKSNLERFWSGLSKTPRLQAVSPLLPLRDECVWVTGDLSMLKRHLRYVAIRSKPDWFGRVITDADILDVWLRPIKVAGNEIYDRDVAATGVPREREISDLVIPPELLIIRVGVKAARNEAMAENFLDAILRREHMGRPTWVVDQPKWSLDNNPDHLCWSRAVQEQLESWKHIVLTNEGMEADGTHTVKRSTKAGGMSPSLARHKRQKAEESKQ